MKKRGLLIGVLLFACVAGMTASETAVAASRVRLCAERKDGTGMDTTYYQSFESARVQANKARRAEIQLLADAGFNGAAKIQSITTNLTIDLNGYRLGDSLCTSPNTVNLLYLNRDTISLTITSSRPGGRIFVARAHDGAICAVNCAAGHLTMEHVRVEVRNLAAASAPNAGSRCVYMGAKGALEMDDCVLEAECSGKGAYGIYTNPYTLSLHRTDHAVVTHTRITASAKAYAYGICAKAHMDMAYVQTVSPDQKAGHPIWHFLLMSLSSSGKLRLLQESQCLQL